MGDGLEHHVPTLAPIPFFSYRVAAAAPSPHLSLRYSQAGSAASRPSRHWGRRTHVAPLRVRRRPLLAPIVPGRVGPAAAQCPPPSGSPGRCSGGRRTKSPCSVKLAGRIGQSQSWVARGGHGRGGARRRRVRRVLLRVRRQPRRRPDAAEPAAAVRRSPGLAGRRVTAPPTASRSTTGSRQSRPSQLPPDAPTTAASAAPASGTRLRGSGHMAQLEPVNLRHREVHEDQVGLAAGAGAERRTSHGIRSPSFAVTGIDRCGWVRCEQWPMC